MNNKGDFIAGDTITIGFNSVDKTNGAPITLAGTPSICVYKDTNTTQTTAGVTLSVDFDSVTGNHLIQITTASDGTFYSAGSSFRVVIAAGTVDGVSVVGAIVGTFTLQAEATRAIANAQTTAQTGITAIRAKTDNLTFLIGAPGISDPLLECATYYLPTDVVRAASIQASALNGKGDWNIGKTGFKLASDGLDSIPVTAPTGVATTFPQMLVQLWRRFFKKSTLTATQLKTYADDGTTVVTTQSVSDDNTTQTQGTAA